MKNLNYYIGERVNPQLSKPYYIRYGQLTKKAAKGKEQCGYGNVWLTPYLSESEYNDAIENLRTAGFSVR